MKKSLHLHHLAHIALLCLLALLAPKAIWASTHYDAGYGNTTTEYSTAGIKFVINTMRIYNYNGNNSHFYSNPQVDVTVGSNTHTFYLGDLSPINQEGEGNEDPFKGGSFSKNTYDKTLNGIHVKAVFSNQRNNQTVSGSGNGGGSNKWCTADLTIEIETQQAATISITGKWRDWSDGVNTNSENVDWNFAIPQHTHNSSGERTVSTPTCTAVGYKIHTCTLCGADQGSKYQYTAALGHGSTGYSCSFKWTGNYSSPVCTPTLTCKLCKANMSVTNPTPTLVKHDAPGCTTSGLSTYTVSFNWSATGHASFTGGSSTHTYEAEDALGHGSGGYTETYAWSGTYDKPACVFTLKCKKCNTNVVDNQSLTPAAGTKVDPECTLDGSQTYSVTGTYNSTNKAYNYSVTNSHSYTIGKLGGKHEYDANGLCTHTPGQFHGKKPTTGDGTAANPYLIATPGNLVWFSSVSNGLNGETKNTAACARLAGDLNMQPVSTFTPIGLYSDWEIKNTYGGQFDGQGYVIRNLHIYAPDTYEAGLFSRIRNATICNLQLEDISVSASGGNHRVGGLIGLQWTGTVVSACAVYGSIDFTARDGQSLTSGGVVGAYNSGTFRCCYTSYPRLDGQKLETFDRSFYGIDGADQRITNGELCYRLNKGVTDGSQYWYQRKDVDMRPQCRPLTDEEKASATIYQHQSCGEGYVYNNSMRDTGAHNWTTESNGFCADCQTIQPAMGEGTAQSPYLIRNAGNLVWFATVVNGGQADAHAILEADISLSGINWTTSIAEVHAYAGIFDGQNHTITGNSPRALFCIVGPDGIVRNVTSASASSKERQAEGGGGYQSPFVRRNYGTIERCIVRGAYWDCNQIYLGGIAGVNEEGGRIVDCGFYDSTLRLRNSRNTQVGGIVGINIGTVENCFTWGINYYNIGSLGRGGITCENRLGATVSNCYTNIDTPIFSQAQPTDGPDVVTDVTANITASFIKSGEMAYRLNHGGASHTDSDHWFQRIGSQTYPDFVKAADKTVYRSTSILCDGTTISGYSYSNTDLPTIVAPHQFEGTTTYVAHPATCTNGPTYYYECSACHVSENDADHLYTLGSPSDGCLGHDLDPDDPTRCLRGCGHTFLYYLSSLTVGEVPPTYDPEEHLPEDFLSYNPVDPARPQNFFGSDGSVARIVSNTVDEDGYGTIEFDRPVTTIGAYAFQSCTGLTGSVTLPSSVTTIGTSAFQGCTGLTGFPASGLPAGLTTIAGSAFAGCTSLRAFPDAGLPAGLTTIGDAAFQGCKNLSAHLFPLPAALTTIGKNAFQGCTSLTGTVDFPTGVTAINEGTFAGCTSLSGTLVIPSHISAVGKNAFQGCTGLSGLTFAEDAPAITFLGASAFAGCSGLTGQVSVPGSVEQILSGAFSGCTGLDAVTLHSIPYFGADAFEKSLPLALDIDDHSYIYNIENNLPAFTIAPTYSRTFTSEWESCVLPFDIDVSGTSHTGSEGRAADVTLYTVSRSLMSRLYVDRATDVIPAGTPFLVHSSAATLPSSVTLTAPTQCTVDASSCLRTDEPNGLTLCGTYQHSTIANVPGYVLAENHWSILPTDTETPLAPFRFYLEGEIYSVDRLTNTSTEKRPMGDINSDGNLSTADLAQLIHILPLLDDEDGLAQLDPEVLSYGDANADGALTTTDVQWMADAIIGLRTLSEGTEGGGSADDMPYVEIGGLRWAVMNLGALSVSGSLEACAGDYYAWGATAPHYDAITWNGNTATLSWNADKADGYKLATAPYYDTTAKAYTAYTDADALTTLSDDDDVVAQALGSGWHMPTSADYQALWAACLGCEPSELPASVSPAVATEPIAEGGIYWLAADQTFEPAFRGVAGVLFVDSADPELRVFFPAAGYMSTSGLAMAGEFAGYWSSSLNETSPNNALNMQLQPARASYASRSAVRYSGRPVRPVKSI